ncbi:N-acetylmuramoyl-L-alanine amidase [Brenneria roseae subsp. roseae]|uniref:N-acetylmuramoyl-L-alanine amidase n=1 Tax=Brenneria roseae TaxID=1509241 RepID=UPI000D621DBD|nr:N-acetylmuramoyl-L-alanine amidase [Brenneria roseae]PWC18655.1 N-acetylmuramoyl-L-alanine amidase [Brenneria roseae subsp. roseae]
MIKCITLLMLFVLAGCQSAMSPRDRSEYHLVTTHESRAQESRVRFLVIHYTAEDFPMSLNILTDAQVSAHYLIPANPPLEEGKPVAWQLVPESQAAWHAGASSWRGFTRLNNSSIGIELENPGYQRTLTGIRWTPFPPAQIALLTAIARQIVARHQIAPQNVVAHSDIAPLRKQDPGPLFPWKTLAQAGIGAWPDESRVSFYLDGRPFSQPVDAGRLLDKLASYGYPLSHDMTNRQKQQVIAAFQMHFRPENYQGHADAQTEAIVDALLEKYGAAR